MRCPVVGPFAPPRQVLSLQGRLRQVALIGIARSVKTVRSWFLWCGRFNFRWANSLFAQRISRRWRPWCNFRASRSWWRGGVWRLRLHRHCLGARHALRHTAREPWTRAEAGDVGRLSTRRKCRSPSKGSRASTARGGLGACRLIGSASPTSG